MGPEVYRVLFHKMLAGEKGQGSGFLLVGAAAAVLPLTRCSAWEEGWLGRCRRMVVRSAFFERGARGERVLNASSRPHRSAPGRGQAKYAHRNARNTSIKREIIAECMAS